MEKGYKDRSRWGTVCTVIIALLVATLVACQAPVTQTPQAPVTQAPASQPPIKIGIFGPMKALHGPAQLNAATIAVEQINKAGGVNVGGVKRQIELSSVDTNEWSSVTDASSAMDRLLTVNKVDFVIGANRSEATLACLEQIADAKVVWIGTGNSATKPCEMVNQNYDRYKYWFKIGSLSVLNVGPDAVSGLFEELLPKIEKETGIKTKDIRVAYILENALWTTFMAKVYDDVAAKYGLTVVGTWKPDPNATDVTAELTAIKDKGAQILLGGMGGSVSVVIPKLVAELKIPVIYGGYSGQTASYGQFKATSGQCEYEWTWNQVDLNGIPGYFQKYNDYPIYVCDAYDAVNVLRDAIERAGTIKADAVIVELEKTNAKGAAGLIKFSPKTDPVAHQIMGGLGYATSYLQQWQKGVPEVIWPNGMASKASPEWAKVKSPGYKPIQLPPWMVQYWKGKS